MSSPAANDLNRILLGSAIGAAIGLVLLALGVAILWNAADQRLLDPAAPVSTASGPDKKRDAAEAPASAMTYPALPAPRVPPPVVDEPPRQAAPSLWGSIFDDGDDQAEAAPPAAPRAAPPAARPAPRPATPRRPPEAQRQDDSLFF